MEHCPVGLNSMVQLYPECISDRKSRFWQIDNHLTPRAEVICPQPCRAGRISFLTDTISRVSSKPRGNLSMYRAECAPEILDIILNKDDLEDDLDRNNQMGFFCGSPPVRTNNPVVHDAQFAKQMQSLAPPLGNSPVVKTAGRVERGSPSCGSSFGGNPKVRVEGFSCGSSESQCVVPALA